MKKATHKEGELKGEPDHDARIEILLDCADEGIGTKLQEYAVQQAAGERLNAVTERYFEQHPRDFDAAWPSELESDKALRKFMLHHIDEKPEVIKANAKAMLGIEVD